MKKTSLVLLFALFVSATAFAGETEATTPAEPVESVVLAKKSADFKEKLRKLLGKSDEEPEEKAFPLSLSIDIASRYVFRGLDFGAGPAIQPGMAYSVGEKVNFEIGAWGSYTLGINSFAEIDMYAALSAGPMTFTFTDYGYPVDGVGDGGYFTYGFKKGTSHIYELAASFGGVDKFPVSIMVGQSLGGAIDNTGDGKRNWDNTYVELGYSPFEGIDIFLGMGGGFYLVNSAGKDRKFNVVNVGLSAGTEMKLGKAKLPIGGSLIFNPDQRNVYFVATIGLSN
jgi:hypothetical protein